MSGSLGVEGVGFADSGAALSVGAADLPNGDACGAEVAGEACAVVAGAFDSDGLHLAEGLRPCDELCVPVGGSGHLEVGDGATEMVLSVRDMHLFVSVDSNGDPRRDGAQLLVLLCSATGVFGAVAGGGRYCYESSELLS